MTNEERADDDGPDAGDDGFRDGLRSAYATYGGPVEAHGDPREAAALTALWAVSDADARALTHGFHAYAGRMHPTTAKRAIERYSAPGGRVLDLFCGGGTTLVEAYALGRAASGSDVSALAVRLARTRTTTLGAVERLRFSEEARRIADLAREMAFARRKPTIPRGASPEFERFEPHVALELFALRGELFAPGPNDATKRALRMCFSSILVKCLKREAPRSAAKPAPADAAGAPDAPADAAAPTNLRRIGRGMPSRWFADRARELADGLAALEAAVPPGTPEPRVEECDARKLEPFADGEFDLVVSSPPYAGVYDYAAEHGVRFDWLGLPRDRMHKEQLGVRDEAVDGTNPGGWIEGRRRWMGEIARTLKSRGRAVLVVGDGIVGRRVEDAAEATAAAAAEAGLNAVARASQARPPLGGSVGRIYGDRPRREHVVLLVKP
jgi:SAM-dependent methyltransferase